MGLAHAAATAMTNIPLNTNVLQDSDASGGVLVYATSSTNVNNGNNTYWVFTKWSYALLDSFFRWELVQPRELVSFFRRCRRSRRSAKWRFGRLRWQWPGQLHHRYASKHLQFQCLEHYCRQLHRDD